MPCADYITLVLIEQLKRVCLVAVVVLAGIPYKTRCCLSSTSGREFSLLSQMMSFAILRLVSAGAVIACQTES